MPDAALEATERQYIDLLGVAAGDRIVHLHFFSLPEIARGEVARSRVEATYGDIDHLLEGRLDALIVTGNEPRAHVLSDEPYWPRLTSVIDWAEHNTTSTIWSCLAAHAAVLHLDGVPRHPCGQKHSGVFDCTKVAENPLVDGVPEPLRITHSRWNDLHEDELVAHGYDVLTRSPHVGVDMFVKHWHSLFVFFQGHPEYDAKSLMREYRRDVGRFLRGESAAYPTIPRHYFDTRSESALEDFAILAKKQRRAEQLADFPGDLALRPSLARDWEEPGTRLFDNWLTYVAQQRRN
jgi:homoserine O-succinyltransferase